VPKVQASKNGKITKYVQEFPNEHFQNLNGEILHCSASEKSVYIKQRFLVVQHIDTTKHEESKIRKQKLKTL